tara:strand:+ start:175 stop:612 length:438 start_codon:yes stop_codon:yes gene_type:complete
MRIVSAEEQIAIKNAGGYRSFVSGVIRQRHGFEVNWENIADNARELNAHISRGDWVVKCDLLKGTENQCGGSIVCSVQDPYMVCDECVNHEYGNQIRRVTFPEEKDRLIIEELLIARPHPGLRNWNGETVLEVQEANINKFWEKI